jgi:hypothetical protein
MARLTIESMRPRPTDTTPPLTSGLLKRTIFSVVPAAAFVRGVALACVVLLASLWGFIVVDLQHEREIHIAQAQRDTENLAIAFENHVESTITSIDALLIALRHELLEKAAPTSQYDLIKWVHEGPLKDSIIQIGVIDSQGYLVYTSVNQSAKPVFVGDRDHFRAHVGATADKLFISKAIHARTSDTDMIPFSRRLTGADGRFQGWSRCWSGPSTFRASLNRFIWAARVP